MTTGGKQLGYATAYLCGLERGPIKVGVTTRRPSKRLESAKRELKNNKLKLFGCWYYPQGYLIEKFAHMHLRNHHIDGEWFSVRADLAREAVEDVVGLLMHPRLEPKPGGNWFDRFGICPRKVRRTFGAEGDVVIREWADKVRESQGRNSRKRADDIYRRVESGEKFKDIAATQRRHFREIETIYYNERGRRRHAET